MFQSKNKTLRIQKINRVIILALLLAETAYLITEINRNQKRGETLLTVVPGKNYSLLIDSERLPLNASPGQEIHISIVEGGKIFFGLPQRVIIPQTAGEDNRSYVHENRFRFYYNTPKQLAPLFKKENLGQLRRKNDWDTVLAVMAKTRNELKDGMPRVYPTQNAADLLDLVRDGKETVFCAQYCYLTVQFLQALGMYARYITILGHEVCEVWLPAENQWVALDPTNGIYFIDASNKKMSIVEVAQAQKNKSVMWAKNIDGSQFSPHEISPPVDGYKATWFWLCNDLVTEPVNIYDLNKYRVRVILDPKDLQTINYGDLYTLDPIELYSPPT